MSLRPWWTPPGPERQDKYLSDDDAVHDMGEALRTAVRRHMISDVPVGAFWSGGIDSSVIVALMAELSSGPVRTFSVRFPGHPDDDVRRAAGMASALGTRHTEIECQAQDFAALPDIVWSLDEPIGDPIVVPTSVLAREARKAVTVVLSGEGADELFGGYLFHRKLVALDQWRTRLPGAVWPFAAWLVERLPRALLDRAFDYPGRLGHEGRRKLAHLFRAAGEDELSELYKTSISLFDADDIAQATSGRLPLPAVEPAAPVHGTSLQRLLALQYADWLPDLILMRSDKIAMAHSLECRVPFLDDLVINTAARGPDAVKLRGKLNKWVLRRFSKSLLPDAFANAPKQAFYAPLDPYLRRGPLREIMDAALDPARLKRRGLFDPGYVAQLAAAPRESFLVEKRLFSILMLELWFERFAPDASWA
jgi:asparagine synthase (glutamine-hydrolysing)